MSLQNFKQQNSLEYFASDLIAFVYNAVMIKQFFAYVID